MRIPPRTPDVATNQPHPWPCAAGAAASAASGRDAAPLARTELRACAAEVRGEPRVGDVAREVACGAARELDRGHARGFGRCVGQEFGSSLRDGFGHGRGGGFGERFAREARSRVVHAIATAATIAGLAMPGCVSRGKAFPPVAATPAAARPPVDAERVSDVPAPGAPSGSIVGSAARLDFRALGTVPTDGFTLPLFSPDGGFFAVQTGVPPDEATLLARPGQRPPLASRIALYRIDGRGLTRLGETAAGLVLGRAADAEGLLVESPRPDGSRWIGRIAWSSATETDGDEPEWLVQDGQVNAFATLGPAGELAYSSRDVRERRFDLVVRRGTSTARLAADGIRSYLYATFRADGGRLRAIALRDGVAELVEADPASSEALAQSIVRTTVSDRADERVAAQMVAPQGVRDALLGDDWLVFHPALGTLVRWRGGSDLRPIAGGALALGAVDASRIAVLSGGRVRLRAVAVADGQGTSGVAGVADMAADVARRDPGTLILDGVAVPRRMGSIDGAPSMVLLVPEAGGVRVVIVRVLPA